MTEEQKRGRGRPPKESAPKVKRPMGRPPLDEPLTGAAKLVYMDECIKAWLIRKGNELPSNGGRRGGAEFMRLLIDATNFDLPPPQRNWPRLAALSLRLTIRQEQALATLALRFQNDVSTLVYERAILPAYLAEHPHLTASPCP